MNLPQELDDLQRMSAAELRAKHHAVFGEISRSGNKPYLRRRIAWRMQAIEQGGLSERAKARARELENDADLRMNPPRKMPILPPDVTAPIRVPPRLPTMGSVLARDYRGVRHFVRVLPKGFEYEGVIYRSLTAVTHKITGQHWNGYQFFCLPGKSRCA